MEAPIPSPKTFTVAQADALLLKVIPLIRQLQGLKNSILETNQQLAEVTNKLAQGNGHPVASLKKQLEELHQHQVRLIDAFHSSLEQFEALGCLLKDLETGLVDFHSKLNGELVFLCWKLGEKKIGFWHDLETGFAGRKPLEASS